jgi:excinuclease ABC subunit A
LDDTTHIRVVGAHQNNLKHLDIDFPKGKLTVVTGVSGSGKSSLVFDTLYAEGQRRYVESFSTYARQFLERMDRPAVTRIDGLLPAVAIEQRNNIRSARSTLGTITELTDYIKLLYTHVGSLQCQHCGEEVKPQRPDEVVNALLKTRPDEKLMISFPFYVGEGEDQDVALAYLRHEGFNRAVVNDQTRNFEEVNADDDAPWNILIDRLIIRSEDRQRLVEALELGYRMGENTVQLHFRGDKKTEPQVLYGDLRHCGTRYPDPRPGMFSFNSPVGACTECNGFGRIIDVDIDRVIPDRRLSLNQGAIRPWTQKKRKWERTYLRQHCARVGIDLDTPFGELSEDDQRWVIDGEPGRGWRKRWPGIRGWFDWLQRKSYRMHVRVFLARYRAYTPCQACDATRFKSESLLWKIAGLHVAQYLALTVNEALTWAHDLVDPGDDRNLSAVLDQIRRRLAYLQEVGLGYLALNRQGRTLSGGEVQRANLTTAIGSGLVNTLFVLDEPSVGLHARDADRLAGMLSQLTEQHNTVVLVEHDPMVLRWADHAVEIGPGPGSAGGRLVYEGSPQALLAHDLSPTAQALRARDAVPTLVSQKVKTSQGLTIKGATANNLKNISVFIPAHKITLLTGVSGSGKSTLVEHVIYRGICREWGRITDAPGTFEAIVGLEHFDDVIWVDQAPPSASSRANSATYVKAWDGIRKLFASQPEAKQRHFTASTFSFNSGTGRCQVCAGSGYEKVEMQFLSDLFIACPVCQGQRFQPDVLEVTWQGHSIADILALTVQEVIALLPSKSAARRKLTILDDVGLGYLPLGQPLSTLSGGEAQRLKLAHHLGSAKTQNTLFLFDEPTTGLHLKDVDRLIANLQKLRDAGNTILVVEHHLDLVDEGGKVVFEGPPAQLMETQTHTGIHLKTWVTEPASQSLTRALSQSRNTQQLGSEAIEIQGARVHNLKNISLKIPRQGRTVISGVSGSGKSSLAFDLVFAEGQRRFLDCLSSYARQYINQLGRPDADLITGIPPTVAIEQRRTRGGTRSNVADATEIGAFIRLLFARAGRDPEQESGSMTAKHLAKRLTRHGRVRVMAPAVKARKGYHKAVFARAVALGHDEIQVDGAFVAPQPTPKLHKSRRHTLAFSFGWHAPSEMKALEAVIQEAAQLGNGEVIVEPEDGEQVLHLVDARNPHAPRPAFDPRLFSPHSDVGQCAACKGHGVDDNNVGCTACDGERLSNKGRRILFDNLRFPEILAFRPDELIAFMDEVTLDERNAPVAQPLFKSIQERASFLSEVGLNYLTLDRRVSTLSGGEFQRIRLAAQLGAHLSGMLYVLDEPTIGLHPTDVNVLLKSLDRLEARGNGVLMVEHDEATIRTADLLIDIGPSAGKGGGEILVAGPVEQALADPRSVTGRCLAREFKTVRSKPRSLKSTPLVTLKGIRHHNLSNADVTIPIARLTIVTGVSGSGKSSLVNDVLAGVVDPNQGAGHVTSASGHESLRRVVHVDDKPIGKNPRSTPATYVGLWDKVRRAFAGSPEARLRGYGPGRFSFNVKGGRCEACAGQGLTKLEMSFLPNAFVTCDICHGRRFNRQTLHITYRGHTITDVLSMSVSEAKAVFEQVPSLKSTLSFLEDVGLGYLPIGQSSTTLSGGEAQRIKLASELNRKALAGTLILLDEPSTGLHLADVPRLMAVIHRLVDKGATIVVIEHHPDIIREADWLIDMGPGGGEAGGQVVYQGAVSGVVHVPESRTGWFLKEQNSLVSS